MQKPLRRCAHPGCHALTSEGYCPRHMPKRERRESAKWRYLYVDPRYGWQKRRTEQLLAEPFCRECAAKGLRVYATDVDHVVPHKGNVELFLHGALQSLCHACHSAKTMRENAESFGARKRAER